MNQEQEQQKKMEQHRVNVATAMAKETTVEGRTRVMLEGTVKAIKAIKREFDAKVTAELRYMEEHIEEMALGVKHGVSPKDLEQ